MSPLFLQEAIPWVLKAVSVDPSYAEVCGSTEECEGQQQTTFRVFSRGFF